METHEQSIINSNKINAYEAKVSHSVNKDKQIIISGLDKEEKEQI